MLQKKHKGGHSGPYFFLLQQVFQKKTQGGNCGPPFPFIVAIDAKKTRGWGRQRIMAPPLFHVVPNIVKKT
jgi:hypothetical protein